MICDAENVGQYANYRHNTGPFIFIFYYEDSNRSNFNLYSRFKYFERDFNDIPIIRFDYLKFKVMLQYENIPSPNHILVLEENDNRTFYEDPDRDQIQNLLLSVRNKRLLHKQKSNLEFICKKQIKMRPWIINSTLLRAEDMREYLEMTAEMQYKFPNSTSLMHRKNKFREAGRTVNRLPAQELSPVPNLNNLKTYSSSKLQNPATIQLLNPILITYNLLRIPVHYVNNSFYKHNFQENNSFKSSPENNVNISLKKSKVLNSISKRSKIKSLIKSQKQEIIEKTNFKKNPKCQLKFKDSKLKLNISKPDKNRLHKSSENNYTKTIFEHSQKSNVLFEENPKLFNSEFINTYSEISSSIKEIQKSNNPTDFIKTIPDIFFNSHDHNLSLTQFNNEYHDNQYYTTDFSELFLQQLISETDLTSKSISKINKE